MDILPTSLNLIINSYFEVNKFILDISLINKKFNKINHSNLKIAKRKYLLEEKYNHYELYYDKNSLLYDMVSTGCRLPFAYSTFQTYNKSIENDIKFIIEMNPEMLNYSDGFLKIRNNVTPVYMACINENIPINIVKIIIDKSTNFYIKLNYHKIHILRDLKHNCNSERFKFIESFFKKIE